MNPIILAIESSCDETAASVLINQKVISNIVASQSIHEQYGGVVPELASRAHQQNIVPVVDQALKKAGITVEDLDAVAFTQGPGLLGALLVGATFAKGLSISRGIPLIGIHHMKAHILSHFIEEPKPKFPFLCLTVSGGHTQIVKVSSPLSMKVLGETQDDAVGEAFDKAAKLLGLPYPGGPVIDNLAKTGDSNRFSFPISDMPGLSFSFSGIKTALLYFVRDREKEQEGFIKENIHDVCASYQHTLIVMLLKKLEKASKETGITEIAIAGGVSANSYLRDKLNETANEKGWATYIPSFEYCTDNAAMIAMAAYYKFMDGQFTSIEETANPRMNFQEL